MKKEENYWTKEKCLNIALKYENKKDFRENDNYPYVKSYKSGWLDEICSHMEKTNIKPKGYWTKEKCIKISYSCKDRKDFRKKYKSAYDACCKNNWLDEIIGESKNSLKKYWVKERCHEKALKYDNRKEFVEKEGIAFSRARHNGWLDEICSHMKIKGNLYKRCIYVFEFSDNSAYVGLTYDFNDRIEKHLIDKKSAVYQHIHSGLTYKTKKLTEYVDVEKAKILESKYIKKYSINGWEILNRMKAGGIGGSLKWTKEKCHIEALKFKYRTEFLKCNSGAYSAARRNDWLNDICSHMIEIVKPNGYWTKENCKNEALKYDKHMDFYNNSRGAYEASKKEEWLDEICSHMAYNKYNKKYTIDECQQEALKYNFKSQFKKSSYKYYIQAEKENWLNDICSHMKERKNNYLTKEYCLDMISKYTRKELRENYKSIYKKSLKNGWLEKKQRIINFNENKRKNIRNSY